MIVDVHTQVFPPDVRDRRDEYLAQDAGFREIYSNAGIPIASAEELLASMDEAGIDVSVVSAFAWNDAGLCRQHSDYLLEAAPASGGRLVPLCIAHPSDKGARDEIKRLASRGARGLGELRPAYQGFSLIDSEEADLLAWAAQAYDLVLLFHVSEPVGRAYPGKSGTPLEQLGRFIEDFPDVTSIAASWGAGLPFYALMPEVARAMSGAYFDTAPSGLAYRPEVLRHCLDLVGAGHILFGSGYPGASQKEARRSIEEAEVDDESKRLILGENAAKLLRLT